MSRSTVQRATLTFFRISSRQTFPRPVDAEVLVVDAPKLPIFPLKLLEPLGGVYLRKVIALTGIGEATADAGERPLAELSASR